MADSLLHSLRDRMLDESEPVAGLLRKCLVLGAETGSQRLREWARAELNGYSSDDDVPAYRKLFSPPLVMDSMSGNTWATGQTVSRFEVPASAREYVPEFISFVQPIEELQQMSSRTSLPLTHPRLAFAKSLWNKELHVFQQIVDLKYIVPGAALSGVVAQVRNTLVDMVADLTASTPLTELPSKSTVDAAVHDRIGDIYNTTIVAPAGPTAVGAGAEASAGVNLEEITPLLSAVLEAASALRDDEKMALQTAVEEVQDVVADPQADTGEVVKRASRLRQVAETLGVEGVKSAAGTLIKTLTDLVIQGAFN
ncbi:hypothetical protein [Curtobacterium sp. NPDC086286]|uniref:AbiTii domain-containing protein n=1 Tax=Curtobacterium sp. NPDC086286 TaxID=3363964 RepID=UPI00380F0356